MFDLSIAHPLNVNLISWREVIELSRLSTELADLGFSTADFRDPDYALFVRKMAQHRKFREPTLTPEEQAEQDRIADEIIEEILREEEDL